MASGHCPECRRRIVLSPASVGQTLTCPHCDIELEVMRVEPHLELDWAYDGAWDSSVEDLKDTIEKVSGLTAGEDFHLAYSPEREDPGRTDHSVASIPKVVGGYTAKCRDKAVALYPKNGNGIPEFCANR